MAWAAVVVAATTAVSMSLKDWRVRVWCASDATLAAHYTAVLRAIAAHVERKPGVASAGNDISCFLSLSTVSLLGSVAPSISALLHYLIERVVDDLHLSTVCVVGPEAVGGMMVAALAATCPGHLRDRLQFVYMRKERKRAGTRKQLEGLYKTGAAVIWLDDTYSTGTSLRAGAALLQADEGLHVVAAVYLVDRNTDRHGRNFGPPPCPVFCVYDLDDAEGVMRVAKL